MSEPLTAAGARDEARDLVAGWEPRCQFTDDGRFYPTACGTVESYHQQDVRRLARHNPGFQHEWTYDAAADHSTEAVLARLLDYASTAARAVDEALSVERVAEVIREAWKSKPPMDSRQFAEYIGAALVAHLRGPR